MIRNISSVYVCVCVSWEGWRWEESALGQVMIFAGGIVCSLGSSISSQHICGGISA